MGQGIPESCVPVGLTTINAPITMMIAVTVKNPSVLRVRSHPELPSAPPAIRSMLVAGVLTCPPLTPAGINAAQYGQLRAPLGTSRLHCGHQRAVRAVGNVPLTDS